MPSINALSLLFFVTILSLVFSTCKKIEEQEEPKPAKGLHVVWKKRMFGHDTSKIFSSGIPYVDQKRVIYPIATTFPPDYLYARNKNTGEFEWSWNEKNRGFSSGLFEYTVNRESYIFVDAFNLFSVQLDNESYLKVPLPLSTANRVSSAFDIVFQASEDQAPASEYSVLHFHDALSLALIGSWTLFRDSTYHPGIEPPIAEIAPNGDTLLYFIARYWNSAGQDRADAFCLNMSRDSLVWQTKDFAHKGNAVISPPLIVDDRIFFRGLYSIVCLSKKSGKQIWEYVNEDTGFGFANLIYNNGLLYAKGWHKNLYVIIADNGKVHDIIEDKAGSNTNNMVLYNDKIYYDAHEFGELVCVDLATHKMEWRHHSPNKMEHDLAGFYHGIAIDQNTGYLYTTDYYDIMCIDLNKTK